MYFQFYHSRVLKRYLFNELMTYTGTCTTCYLQKARVGLYSYLDTPARGGIGTTSEITHANPAINLAGLLISSD